MAQLHLPGSRHRADPSWDWSPVASLTGGAPCPHGCLIDTPDVRGAWTVLAHRECARRILDAARHGTPEQQRRAAVLLEQYADLYHALPGEHGDAPAWMLRGRLFHQGLTEAIWAVTIAQAAWQLADSGVAVAAPVARLLDNLAAAARAGRDSLVADGKFTSNYVAWLDAAGACCTRDPEWLTGEHGLFNHVLAATGEDGWQWEASTYYHSFVLRAANAALAAVPTVAPPEPVRQRLNRMRSVLTRLQTDSGLLPALHDGPYRSSDYDAELAELDLQPEARSDGVTVFPDAGYAIVRSHGLHAVVDFGAHGGSHGHRDKLSLYLYGPGTAWQPDPGQVPYGHHVWRTLLRQHLVPPDVLRRRPGPGRVRRGPGPPRRHLDHGELRRRLPRRDRDADDPPNRDGPQRRTEPDGRPSA